MSQDQLSSAAGLSQPYLGLVERGENSPTITVVFRLCEALGTSPAELLDAAWRDR
jgi:transcriptional regulator with XRE-family HTH domain